MSAPLPEGYRQRAEGLVRDMMDIAKRLLDIAEELGTDSIQVQSDSGVEVTVIRIPSEEITAAEAESEITAQRKEDWKNYQTPEYH